MEQGNSLLVDIRQGHDTLLSPASQQAMEKIR